MKKSPNKNLDRLTKKAEILAGLKLEIASLDDSCLADLDAFEKRLRETRSLLQSMMDDVYKMKNEVLAVRS